MVSDSLAWLLVCFSVSTTFFFAAFVAYLTSTVSGSEKLTWVSDFSPFEFCFNIDFFASLRLTDPS